MANEGLRDYIKTISPPWLSGGVAEKYLYIQGLILDAYLENLNQGIKARMPGGGTETALRYIGDDRAMPRGLSETDEAYAIRLSHAFLTWRTAGSPHAVLRQTLIALGLSVMARTVSNTGVWHTIEAGAVPDANGDLPVVQYRAVPNNWDWDGLIARWWRAWVIVYGTGVWTRPAWGDTGLTWSANRTWGSTATPAEISTLRAQVLKWKPAHCVVLWIIISFDNSLFSPTASPGAPMPAGAWSTWSSGGLPTRDDGAIYADGVT